LATRLYDSLGWTTTVTAPDGSATTFLHLGNTLTMTDAQGKWKRHEQDGFGHLLSVAEPRQSGGADDRPALSPQQLVELIVRILVVELSADA